jgi:large subunit ribosomal protein L21
MSLYAIIETGGKQYKVSHNDIIKIEKIPGNVGEIVEFNKIQLLNTGKDFVIDEKELSNASVKGKIIAQEKDKKIIVFKFKRRKNFKKKRGHRQQITRVLIKEIYFGKDLLTPEDDKKKVSKKEEAVKEPVPEILESEKTEKKVSKTKKKETAKKVKTKDSTPAELKEEKEE